MNSSFITAVSKVARIGPLDPRCCYRGYRCDSFRSRRIQTFTKNYNCSVPSEGYPIYKRGLIGTKFSVPFRAFLNFGKSGRPSVSLGFSKSCRTGTRGCARILFNRNRAFGTKAVNALTSGATCKFIGGCCRRHNREGHNYRVRQVARKYAKVQQDAKRRPKKVMMLPRKRDVGRFAPIRRPTGSVRYNVAAARFSCRSVSRGLLGLSVLKRSSPAVVHALRSCVASSTVRGRCGRRRPFITARVPLSSGGIVRLFRNARVLKVGPRSVSNYGLKYLKVPRFNASFIVRVIRSAGPRALSSLVQVSNLSRKAGI